jgi:hypothetical protein
MAVIVDATPAPEDSLTQQHQSQGPPRSTRPETPTHSPMSFPRYTTSNDLTHLGTPVTVRKNISATVSARAGPCSLLDGALVGTASWTPDPDVSTSPMRSSARRRRDAQSSRTRQRSPAAAGGDSPSPLPRPKVAFMTGALRRPLSQLAVRSRCRPLRGPTADLVTDAGVAESTAGSGGWPTRERAPALSAARPWRRCSERRPECPNAWKQHSGGPRRNACVCGGAIADRGTAASVIPWQRPRPRGRAC